VRDVPIGAAVSMQSHNPDSPSICESDLLTIMRRDAAIIAERAAPPVLAADDIDPKLTCRARDVAIRRSPRRSRP
jgi:hypothetical protein